MTSPAGKPDRSWSGSDPQGSPDRRVDGEGESRHLSVLVLEEASPDGVTLASILGHGGSGMEASGDREPEGGSEPHPDAIVVDLSSASAEGG